LFGYPTGLCFDKNGDLFITDSIADVVRMMGANGIMSTIAGNDQASLDPAEEAVPASQANLFDPVSITIDVGGQLYTVGQPSEEDSEKDSISSSNVSVIIRTARGVCLGVAGIVGFNGFNGDGLPGLQTVLDGPSSVLFAPSLGLVFSDTYNNRVRLLANLAQTTTNSVPTAVITATPGSLGNAPFKVHLDGSLSTAPDGDIVSYQWNFGDGTTGNGEALDHTYGKTGSYTVELTVTDTKGNTSTAKLTIFAAIPIIASKTTGKGAFKLTFGSKASKTSDSFALTMTNVAGVSGQTTLLGKAATITMGTYSVSTTVLGKGIKAAKAPATNVAKLTFDPVKDTITIAITKTSLGSAFADFGVVNANSIGTRTAVIPVVISVNNGAFVIGDNFPFTFVSKYNSSATGKFSQL
jgi:PKD repeat protein